MDFHENYPAFQATDFVQPDEAVYLYVYAIELHKQFKPGEKVLSICVALDEIVYENSHLPKRARAIRYLVYVTTETSMTYGHAVKRGEYETQVVETEELTADDFDVPFDEDFWSMHKDQFHDDADAVSEMSLAEELAYLKRAG